MAPTDLLYLRLLTGLFALASAVLVPAALRQRHRELLLGAEGRVTEATVVGATHLVTTMQRTAEVRFQVGEQDHHATVPTRSTLTEGDRVRLRYRAGDPTQAVLTAPAEAVPRGAWVQSAFYAGLALALFLVLGAALVAVSLP